MACSSRLITWPNHLNWSVCMVPMIGFLHIPCLFPFTNHSTFISAAVILLFSFFVSTQDSCPYNSIGLRMVLCIRRFALLGTCQLLIDHTSFQRWWSILRDKWKKLWQIESRSNIYGWPEIQQDKLVSSQELKKVLCPGKQFQAKSWFKKSMGSS